MWRRHLCYFWERNVREIKEKCTRTTVQQAAIKGTENYKRFLIAIYILLDGSVRSSLVYRTRPVAGRRPDWVCVNGWLLTVAGSERRRETVAARPCSYLAAQSVVSACVTHQQARFTTPCTPLASRPVLGQPLHRLLSVCCSLVAYLFSSSVCYRVPSHADIGYHEYWFLVTKSTTDTQITAVTLTFDPWPWKPSQQCHSQCQVSLKSLR